MRVIDNQLWVKIAILVGTLTGLPLLGVYLAGQPLAPYLEFPPVTRHVRHAPFSWWAFIPLAVVIATAIGLLAARAWKYRPRSQLRSTRPARPPLPWWGWLGMAGLPAAWILAWGRFDWLRPVQAHTFTPLWVAYILVVNALCQQQTGSCLMRARPVYFISLFPLSAIFWWFFEYLNRFVQNWYYIGTEFSPWSYFWYATLPFSTVLPAVLSTCRWLEHSAWIRAGFTCLPPIAPKNPKRLAVAVLAASAAGLTAIGIWPGVLFPLLWLSPLLIFGSLQTLAREHHIFAEMAAGDWRRTIAAAVAALICGLFWEMWNIYSLAKWKYSIPLVHRFLIFEMPVLGFAGYLPFGLECIVIGDLLKSTIEKIKSSRP